MKKLKNFKKGFTIAELLTSFAIMAVIMTIVLWNYGRFNDSLALNAAAQEMAVAIRQAQTFGINVKEAASGGGQFNYSFGVHIDPGGSPSSYNLFTTDANVNKKYDVGESVETIAIRNGVRITDITTSDACQNASPNRTLDITFRRPNPDADINFVNNGGNIYCNSKLNATITLTSPKGSLKYVIIDSSGQILVQ